MRRIEVAGYEVRIEDRHPPGRAAEFLRDPERHQEPLRLWRETLEHVARAAGVKRQFAAGFVLDEQRVALSPDGDHGAVICINPERFSEAIAKYGHEPLSLAAYLHSVACHELAHLDGRMGRGHDEEYIAAREEMGAVTAHTLPLIADAAACLLGLGPCTRRPTQVNAARQEAIRACREVARREIIESLVRRRRLPRADVVRRVRAQLGPQHLRPDFRRARPRDATPSWGCCYVAAEAVWHALGGPDSGLRPTFIRHEGAPHWYLVDVVTGEVVDPTVDQFSSPPDYSRGIGKGFLTLDPSQRSQAILSAARLPTILRTRASAGSTHGVDLDGWQR